MKNKGLFDRIAEVVANEVSRAWFFMACVALVVVWVPTLWFLKVDTSQLIINTATTIITFLLLALLQNTQKRSDVAIQTKLNAIAEGLRDVMDEMARENPEFVADIEKLEESIGLEDSVGTKASD